jgi:anthranilate synthase component 1
MQRVLVADDLTPAAAYAALRDRGRPSFLLESAPIGGERWGRYSVIGWRPRRAITLDLLDGGGEVELTVRSLPSQAIVEQLRAPAAEALALLRSRVEVGERGPRDAATPQIPRVIDAAVGYLAYDLVHALEPIAPWPGRRRLAHLLDDATTIVFDALLQTVTIHGEHASELDAAAERLSRAGRLAPLPLPKRSAAPEELHASLSDDEYARIVERAKHYIAAGDVFQVVLARTFSTPRRGADPFDAYRALRVLNPSPYLYFVDLAGADDASPQAIAGASPEILVRLEDGRVVVRPLAGTRPRGADAEADAKLAEALLADPKERAEHVMLVDLGRNDVGRVAAIGSVEVPTRMVIERYSHVMHLVSEVRGTLAENRDAWDVLAAAFPAGTLSGAPKVRAMQIIRELEPAPRGIYGGAIGYVSRHGTMDVAIAIRTLVAWPDRFEVGAGAGVVEASDPAAEAAETRHKAGAALAAARAALDLVGAS